MLRSAREIQRKATTQSWKLVVFSVGGRKLAAKAEEVLGITKWKESAAVPSQTPFVSSVIRSDDSLLAVFDLAGLLNVSVQGRDPLCLTVKHPRGPMGIRIDGEMPVLQTLDGSSVHPCYGEVFDSFGSFTRDNDDIPIIVLAKLGSGGSA